MGEVTGIAWCDHTFNPWRGCTRVSPGCDHCYAERMNRWLKAGENWGPGAPRLEYSDEHWKKPGRWAAKAQREGTRPKVFPSVCDPFDNEVPPEWRARFFALIAETLCDHKISMVLSVKHLSGRERSAFMVALIALPLLPTKKAPPAPPLVNTP